MAPRPHTVTATAADEAAIAALDKVLTARAVMRLKQAEYTKARAEMRAALTRFQQITGLQSEQPTGLETENVQSKQ